MIRPRRADTRRRFQGPEPSRWTIGYRRSVPPVADRQSHCNASRPPRHRSARAPQRHRRNLIPTESQLASRLDCIWALQQRHRGRLALIRRNKRDRAIPSPSPLLLSAGEISLSKMTSPQVPLSTRSLVTKLLPAIAVTICAVKSEIEKLVGSTVGAAWL